jgi:hypothetical protein
VLAKLAALTAGCVLLIGFAGGCGDGSDGPDSSRPVTETVDPVPKLPRGWKPHVNRDGGFALGVPPGWSARAHGAHSELRSPDRLVAISIAADRSEETLAIPLPELARTTLDAGLPGIRKLEARDPRPNRHRYDAVSLAASALAGKDPPVRERLTLIVIRRQGLATYTALAAENTEASARPHREEIERALRSLRGRPIGARRGAGLPNQRSGRSG